MHTFSCKEGLLAGQTIIYAEGTLVRIVQSKKFAGWCGGQNHIYQWFLDAQRPILTLMQRSAARELLVRAEAAIAQHAHLVPDHAALQAEVQPEQSTCTVPQLLWGLSTSPDGLTAAGDQTSHSIVFAVLHMSV